MSSGAVAAAELVHHARERAEAQKLRGSRIRKSGLGTRVPLRHDEEAPSEAGGEFCARMEMAVLERSLLHARAGDATEGQQDFRGLKAEESLGSS